MGYVLLLMMEYMLLIMGYVVLFMMGYMLILVTSGMSETTDQTAYEFQYTIYMTPIINIYIYDSNKQYTDMCDSNKQYIYIFDSNKQYIYI